MVFIPANCASSAIAWMHFPGVLNSGPDIWLPGRFIAEAIAIAGGKSVPPLICWQDAFKVWGDYQGRGQPPEVFLYAFWFLRVLPRRRWSRLYLFWRGEVIFKVFPYFVTIHTRDNKLIIVLHGLFIISRFQCLIVSFLTDFQHFEVNQCFWVSVLAWRSSSKPFVIGLTLIQCYNEVWKGITNVRNG